MPLENAHKIVMFDVHKWMIIGVYLFEIAFFAPLVWKIPIQTYSEFESFTQKLIEKYSKMKSSLRDAKLPTHL